MENIGNNEKVYTVYGRRWAVIIAFVLVNTIYQCCAFWYASILTDAWHYFGFTTAATGEAAMSALLMIFMVFMIGLSVPASALFDKLGWYKPMAIFSVIFVIFALLRGFAAGANYTLIVVFTVGIALTQPFIINTFGMISATWFPPKERGITNGLGMVSTFTGTLSAQFGVPVLINMGLDISGTLKVMGVVSIPIVLFFLVVARERPPTPPAEEELIERASFKEGFKQLVKNKQFINALLIFWILQGLFFSFTGLIEPILQFLNNNSLDILLIGTLGTIISVTGSIASLVFPTLTDRTKEKKRLPLIRVCLFGSLIGVGLFFLGQGAGLLILAACIFGIFLVGITPILLVFGYEAAYPVSEGITESLMQLGANGMGLVFMLLINAVFRGQHTGSMLFYCAGVVICLIMCIFLKESSLRARKLKVD